MPKLRDVCRNVRSKVAGPFWVTVDVFFDGEAAYRKHHAAAAIQPAALAELFRTDPDLIAIYPVEALSMVKISFPRAAPQGGVVERDLHSGQQYVDLLDCDL
ncbi:MAG TPA: DUF4387 family protein [Caulobacteraceae bacterium]|nr:DUF4387 family protein [Caulobacteraceae bacterium]